MVFPTESIARYKLGSTYRLLEFPLAGETITLSAYDRYVDVVEDRIPLVLLDGGLSSCLELRAHAIFDDMRKTPARTTKNSALKIAAAAAKRERKAKAGESPSASAKRV